MNEQREKRLNSLLGAVPEGFLVDAAWMTKRGISRTSIHDYAARGWLERVGRGVYRRPLLGSRAPWVKTDWRIVVLSLQRLLGYDVHVGGGTALHLHGHMHYLMLGRGPDVFLYGDDAPSWLSKIPADASFVLRTRNLFGDNRAGIKHWDFDLVDEHLSAASNDRTPMHPWTWPLTLSSVERATLELLNELPKHESFHQVDVTFQGLTDLRPKPLQEMLAACRSIKVKRLFFLFADRHQHGWLKHLDRDAVYLGSGDRQLVPGGRFHPLYKITVPPEFTPEASGKTDGP